MKIVVISDTHGFYRVLETVFSRHKDADLFLHLGDGAREISLICDKFPEITDRFFFVRGNCDYSDAPYERTLDLVAGHRLFMTHGHRYRVKYSPDFLAQIARENGCDIALYGHTHCASVSYEGGIYLLNPGSASMPRDENDPSYALMDVTHEGILPNIVSIS